MPRPIFRPVQSDNQYGPTRQKAESHLIQRSRYNDSNRVHELFILQCSHSFFSSSCLYLSFVLSLSLCFFFFYSCPCSKSNHTLHALDTSDFLFFSQSLVLCVAINRKFLEGLWFFFTTWRGNFLAWVPKMVHGLLWKMMLSTNQETKVAFFHHFYYYYFVFIYKKKLCTSHVHMNLKVLH